jgi:hypothetical protein
VTDAVTRLQRERDLALRRVDELHVYYKKELKSKDDNNHKSNQWRIDEYKNRLLINEQKRHETHKDRMKDDVHRAKIAVSLRTKIQDLQQERSTMKKQH